MDDSSMSLADIGALVETDKSTISRALASEAFSDELAVRIRMIVGPANRGAATPSLLRQSLHLLRLSDTLRRRAEERLVQALDRAVAGE